MNLIFKAVDQVEKLLGHSPHPAIVAVPLGAWAVSNLCDVAAELSGDDRYDDVARISMAIGLVGAAGAVITGLHDYSMIPKDRPSHKTATTHALGNSVVVSLIAASYIMRVREEAQGHRTSPVARILGLAGGALSIYTSWLGGKLVEEQGEGVKPVMERLEREERGGKPLDYEEHGPERLSPTSPLGLHLA